MKSENHGGKGREHAKNVTNGRVQWAPILILVLTMLAPSIVSAQGNLDERLKMLQDGYERASDAALLHKRLWTLFYGGSVLVNIGVAGTTVSPDPEIPVSDLLVARTAGVSDEILLGLAARDSYRVRITDLERTLAFQAFGTNGLAFTEAMSENYDEYVSIRRAKERSSMITLTSSLGLLIVLMRPHPALSGYERIEKMPANTPDEKRRKLEAMEAWFSKGAEAEQRAVGMRAHIISTAVAAIAGAGIVGGYKQPARFGWFQFALTFLTAELRLWTYPEILSETREEYRKKGFAAGREERSRVQFAGIAASPGGIAAVFRF